MKIQHGKNLGWVMAAALAGVAFVVGFDNQTEKYGVADIATIIEKSELGKTNQTTFAAMKAAREALLQFIDQNRVMTVDHATRLRELSLKLAPTKEETAEIDRLKADATASSKRLSDLSGKPNLSDADRAIVEDSAGQSAKIEQMAQQWYKDFSQEMQDWADTQKQASIVKARTAIQEVAKVQGYSIVFEAGPAPYGANDISDAALKAMNDKK